MPGLAYQPVATGGIHRAQDRPDVLWILDAVEHDQQRHGGGLLHQFLDRVRGQGRQFGRDALVNPATRQPVERPPVQRLDNQPELTGPGHERIDTRTAATFVHQLRHAPRLERLGYRIDPVDNGHR